MKQTCDKYKLPVYTFFLHKTPDLNLGKKKNATCLATWQPWITSQHSNKHNAIWIRITKFELWGGTCIAWLLFILQKISSQKARYIRTSSLCNKYKKALLVLKIFNKKCHGMIYSNCALKSFLSLADKYDFSSKLFGNWLVC